MANLVKGGLTHQKYHLLPVLTGSNQRGMAIPLWTPALPLALKTVSSLNRQYQSGQKGHPCPCCPYLIIRDEIWYYFSVHSSHLSLRGARAALFFVS